MSDSLINALTQIWAYQHQRPVIIRAGTQALHRLIPVALSRTATGKTVGRFLLGLYDGAAFRFDLKQLHQLGVREFEDCLQVLEMDYMPEVEVHQRIDEGEHVWHELMDMWRNQPAEFACHQPARPHRKGPCTPHLGAIEARGIEAFDRLLHIAGGCTGQSRIVAVFLMSLIHNGRYRLNLTDLRGLDITLFEDCLSVLRMDYFTDTEAGKP
ncbi:hypothetical protein GCM10008969_33700 [Pseudomonas veronii subsp. inensis]|uniref:DUF7673 family protein n=1 Tax=Pseudomonas veronii TaxID=76761 RepID=UPI0031F79E26